jgi:phosphoglycolate phosphatase
MKFDAVLFDLDGTLVDSVGDIAEAMNRVLTEHHFPVHSPAAYKRFVGNGLLNLCRITLPATARDEETVMACHDRLLEVYDGCCTESTRPYEGIVPLLNELKLRALKLAVLSNKADRLTVKIVQTLLPGYFDTVVGMTAEALRKPNPACALQIVERLGRRPESTVFLGDTGIDMRTARNAGMYGVGVLWGFRTEAELIAAGAGRVLSRPLDLIGLL